MDSSFTQPSIGHTWDSISELPDLGLLLQATPCESQLQRLTGIPTCNQAPGQTRVAQISPGLGKSHDDFLHSIYVLRNAFRQSCTPSAAEVCRLVKETGLQPYQISMWFDGERSQRDFWISQNGFPTPPISRKLNQTFNQSVASDSNSEQVAIDVSSTIARLQDDFMLGMLSQATVGPQSTEGSSSNSVPKLRRDEDSHRISEPANHPPKRAQKQYRSRRSNQDGQDDNTRTFGCPTCPPPKSLSKSVDEWYSHQKRCHFPRQIWVCRSAGQKSCKIAPSKRQDNFRNHLKNTHGFTAGHELDFEVRKKTIKVNGLFHEKCGFCEQDLASWEASMLHIWEHVESGARMADWNHVCETDHELTANVHYEIPHEHSVLDKDSSDEDDPNDDDPNSGGSAGEKFDFGPYGGLDDFNFDQDFNGEDYDCGMGPADQENTLNAGFYMSRTNSPPSGTNVAIDQDASQPRSQSTLAEAESPTIEDGNSNQDPAAPGFQDFEQKLEILDMLQHLFSNLRVSETPTTTELPTCKEENAGIQGVGPTTPQYMPNNTSGRADMLQLQREVTGYQVVFDCNGQWRIASPGRWSFRDKLSEGVSRIQIWHWKPLFGDLTTKLPVSSPIGSVLTLNSALSEISTTGEDKVNTGIKSQISGQEHSKTMYATASPLPVIVIFTREKDKENRDICSYIRLELDFGIDIVPTLCKCHKSPLTCKQVVLQRKKGSEGSFEIRKLSVPLNNLSHWDLAAFAHPRNPKFDDKKLLPRTRCSYLALDFEAVADKDNFTKSFRVAMILRDRADGLSRDALRMARHLEVGDSSNLEYLQKLRKQEASTMTTVGPIAKNNRLSSQPSSHPVIYFNN